MGQIKYFFTFLFITIFIFAGCAPVHFTVNNAPVAPEHTGSFKTTTPEIPLNVQITNFIVESVDTQYSEKEKELFRRNYSIAIQIRSRNCWVSAKCFRKLLELPQRILLIPTIWFLAPTTLPSDWVHRAGNGFLLQDYLVLR